MSSYPLDSAGPVCLRRLKPDDIRAWCARLSRRGWLGIFRSSLLACGAALATGVPVAGESSRGAGASGEEPPPNVVFILADDLGWMDLGCYGSTFFETPNLDGLAEQGMRFTQAYVASPLCAPARSSIITGLDPARTGMTFPDIGHQEVRLEKRLRPQAPADEPFLHADPVTVLSTEYFSLGKAFKEAGYVTGHFGKWHLGRPPYSPLQHGFDVDIPHTNAPGPLLHGWFHPFHVWPGHGERGDNLEDLLAIEAAEFILENKDRPFFLNYWAFQVHSPWEAKEEQIERYADKAEEDALQRNPVYAGMVETFDDAVGTLMEALDEAGVRDNTVIVFLSDNGPFVAAHPAPVMMEGFTRIPPTSVLPLRGGKNTLYEGGIRIPQIIIWPGVTEPGSVTDELAFSNDFYPTFVDMFGWADSRFPDFDGVSLRPLLEGTGSARDEIFAHFPHRQDTRPYEQMPFPNSPAPATSLRKGDWKIIRFFADGEEGADRFELYNLKEDLGETNDLAGAEPERAAELNTLLDERLEETEAVIPRRNPAYGEPERSGGWQSSPDAIVTPIEGALHVESIGNDPWISTRDLPADARGPFTLRLRMKSNADGEGRVYFTSRPGADFNERHALPFSVTHDGRTHEYQVEIPVAMLSGLRIDPANTPGEIAIIGIDLFDGSGEKIRLSDDF